MNDEALLLLLLLMILIEIGNRPRDREQTSEGRGQREEIRNIEHLTPNAEFSQEIKS